MGYKNTSSYPVRLALNKKKKRLLAWSFIILCVVTLVICTQKFFRFGFTPEYNFLNSFIFNFVTIVPFILCILLGLRLSEYAAWASRGRNIIFIVLSSLLLFGGYIFSINAILYILGFSSSIINDHFLWKYLTGVLQVHLVLYLFIQFYMYRPNRVQKTPKTITVSKAQTTRTLKTDSISRIESYDHYIKIFTKDGVFLKRQTMKGIIKQLEDDFVRIHRKYIVNKKRVDHICRENGKIYLVIDGKKLKVSNTYLNIVEKLF